MTNPSPWVREAKDALVDALTNRAMCLSPQLPELEYQVAVEEADWLIQAIESVVEHAIATAEQDAADKAEAAAVS